MSIRGFVVAATGLAIGLGVSQASAQQFNEPFSFRVHNNVAAMNMAVILRNIQNGDSSASSYGSGGSSGGSAIYNIYSTTSIGNMNEITAILEQGASGYINLDANISQDSSGDQSATNDVTQIVGGSNTADGDVVNNNGEETTE